MGYGARIMTTSLTRPRPPRVPQTLRVHEIFHSIQGESSWAGRPCTFVRLTGCPLRCSYCDTEHAFYDGKTQTFSEVFRTVDSWGCRLVELTGGEPLAQKNAIPFLEAASRRGYQLMLETSGALSIADVPRDVKIIMDIKTPDSREQHRNFWDNLGWLKPGVDELKFVVASRGDFEFAAAVMRERRLGERFEVLLSPVHGVLDLQQLSAWMLESRLPFRLQLQMHKYIWGAEARGV